MGVTLSGWPNSRQVDDLIQRWSPERIEQLLHSERNYDEISNQYDRRD